MSQWRDSLTAYIRSEALPVDKFGHMPRLYALACRLGDGLQYDDDVLFAAVWLHDLGVFVGHRPEDAVELAQWDHVPYAIAKSRDLLPKWGFPTEKLSAVADVIQTHQPKDTPIRIEAVIMRDADILEQLGAIGLMRAVAKTGRDTRFPTFSSVLPVLRRAAEELPGALQLDQSRRLAEPRIDLLKRVIIALEEDAGPLLF